MIGRNLWGLVAGATLTASLLVAGGVTQPAAAAPVPWTGTISVSESANNGTATISDGSCQVTEGNDGTNTALKMNWGGSFDLTNISFVPDGSTDVFDHATVDASLTYSETGTRDNPNCKHPTESWSGTFGGGNTTANEPAIDVEADATHLYLTLTSGMVAGSSDQTGDDPETDNSATWRESTSTITVPITGNTATGTFSDATIKDDGDGLHNTEFYGYSPFGLSIPTDNTVQVNLSRGPGTPKPKAPTTAITKSPAAKTTAKTATFKFTSNTKHVTFHCSLDGKKAAACTSPKSYKKLKAGKHTFSVYAVNPKTKLSDKSPAKKSWTIKKKPGRH
jgi:hypothetical protein